MPTPQRLLATAVTATLLGGALAGCSALSGPSGPTVGDDLAVVLEPEGSSSAVGIVGDRTDPATPAALVMPQVSLSEVSLTTTTELDGDATERSGLAGSTDGEDLLVPDGTELLVVELQVSGGPWSASGAGADAGAPTATVQTAGGPQPVDLLAVSSGPLGSTLTLAVVAEPGQPVPLQVTDQGETAGIDLRTGAGLDDPRSQQATAPTTLALGGEDVEQEGLLASTEAAYAGVEPREASLTARFSQGSAALLSWVPGEGGWAAPDRAWLALTVTVDFYGGIPFAQSIDLPARAWTLTPDGGEPARAQNASSADTQIDLEGQTLYFDVPLGLTGATAALDPGLGTFDAARWAQAPGPLSTTVAPAAAAG